MFSIGIVGLPNVGKSLLFKTLTKKEVKISNYPFSTIDPNRGLIEVPDQRLNLLFEKIKPERKVPVSIEFIDIAGLVKGASKGEGLGNQFLEEIRKVDAIVHLVRFFEDEKVPSSLGKIDPIEEIDHFVFNYKRGGHYLFGRKVFSGFMGGIGGRVMVRSHEYFSAGYKFIFNHKILSIFSNGGTSPYSGYRDFILRPKYAKVYLAKPLSRWTAKQVFDIKY